MNHEENDKPIRDLIARVFLPPDECPADSASIEAMLDRVHGRPLSDEQVERMLKKAKGELPVGERGDEDEEVWSEDELSAEQREFVFLCRNQGTELPPEIEEKIRRLREKAESDDEEEEDDELDS